MTFCPSCRSENPDSARFCANCGSALGPSCRSCGADLPPGARFCPACGVTTHFGLTESAQAKHGNVLTGVNMRLAEESDLTGIELRFPDGRAWSGEGGFSYVREAVVLGS